MKRKFPIVLMLFFVLKSFSQDFKQSLKQLEIENINCLDKGKFMYDCSLKYYNKTDSLLNVVYRFIRKDLTDVEKGNLKSEQLKWLKVRDFKFSKIDSEQKEDGLDHLMIASQKKSEIVNERINYLIEKFNPNKQNQKIDLLNRSHVWDATLDDIICKDLNIKSADVLQEKSAYVYYNDKTIFASVTYKSNYEEGLGNLLNTVFLLINLETKQVINKLEYGELSYFDEEVGQPGEVNISSCSLDLGLQKKGIAVNYEISMGGCANSYHSDNLVFLIPVKNTFSEVLKPFHFNRTISEGNCNSDYSFERQMSSIEIIKNEKFDLKILTKITFEINREENLKNNEKKRRLEKSKTITRTISLNSENKYIIEELPYFFFEN